MFNKFKHMMSYEYASESWKNFFISRISYAVYDVAWIALTSVVAIAVMYVYLMISVIGK